MLFDKLHSATFLKKLPGFVLIFWIVFWFAYPYHELIDDSRYRGILEHRYFFFDALIRPLHAALLWVQGDLTGGSMPAALLVGLLFHFLLGGIAWKKIIPLLPYASRPLAKWGLIAFMVHPVSLQTVVHVAQGSEILGALALAVGILPVLRFIPADLPKKQQPVLRDFRWLICASVIAVLSKENYILPLFAVSAALAWRSRLRAGWMCTAAIALLAIGGALANNFSRDVIQNQSNYTRSQAFRRAFLADRVISPESSIILPLRSRNENLKLQVSLLPVVLKTVAAPFRFTDDYGYFPFGKQSDTARSPWFVCGLLLLLLGLAAAYLLGRRFNVISLSLILMPAALYCVYWVFPVYDPLMSYRLYGVVFSALVLSIPLLLPEVRPGWVALAPLLALMQIAAGGVRAWEMHDQVLEADVAISRCPWNFRGYDQKVSALVAEKRFPLDCGAVLGPALALAPSPAHVYINWAWCESLQGRKPEARALALKSLEYESVPENVHTAINFVIQSGNAQFDGKAIHPENMKIMIQQPGS
jgi:hypothetical protein